MAKKSLKKKIKSNKLTMQEVVISLFLVLVLGISISVVSSFAVNVFAQEKNVNSNNNHQDQEELKESPYTLDEIYDFISSKKYLKISTRDEEWFDYNNVITHFYEYFSKDTPFMIYDKKLRSYWGDYQDVDAEIVNTIMINYDEYMEITKGQGEAATGIRWTDSDFKTNRSLYVYRVWRLDNAARDVVGSCYEINRCANPEENDNYKKEGNV